MIRGILSARQPLCLTLSACFVLTMLRPLAAAEPDAPTAQELLDRAVETKLSARSMSDLEKAIGLCEQAMEAGLDQDGTVFANSLLTSTLFEHARRIADNIFDRESPNPRWPVLRRLALQDLDKAL